MKLKNICGNEECKDPRKFKATSQDGVKSVLMHDYSQLSWLAEFTSVKKVSVAFEFAYQFLVWDNIVLGVDSVYLFLT